MTDTRVLHVECRWNNGTTSRHLVLEEDLGGLTWEAWVSNLLADPRPRWHQLGDIVFYTQTVLSIELIDAVATKED